MRFSARRRCASTRCGGRSSRGDSLRWQRQREKPAPGYPTLEDVDSAQALAEYPSSKRIYEATAHRLRRRQRAGIGNLTVRRIIVGTMDVPPVQFTRTSDGVSIAYTVAGSGPPLVYCWGTTSSHTELFWRSPGLRAPLEQMSAHFTVYQFDWRNTGSSTRGVPFGRDEWIRDMEAVFSLFDGPANIVAGGPPVAPYVAHHQERIRRWVTFNQHRWPERIPAVRAAAQIPSLFSLDAAWVRLNARRLAGEVPEATLRDYQELTLSCCDRGYSAQVQPMISSWDITPYLERIAVPTLVVHRRGLGAEIGADYAAHIAGAQLYLVEGSSWLMPGEEDPVPAILAFLTGEELVPSAAVPTGALGLGGLSPRECEVLALIAAGKTNPEIAHALTITTATASKHVHNILEKLGMSRRSEAAAWWASNGKGH